MNIEKISIEDYDQNCQFLKDYSCIQFYESTENTKRRLKLQNFSCYAAKHHSNVVFQAILTETLANEINIGDIVEFQCSPSDIKVTESGFEFFLLNIVNKLDIVLCAPLISSTWNNQLIKYGFSSGVNLPFIIYPLGENPKMHALLLQKELWQPQFIEADTMSKLQ